MTRGGFELGAPALEELDKAMRALIAPLFITIVGLVAALLQPAGWTAIAVWAAVRKSMRAAKSYPQVDVAVGRIGS
jgi:hypothetical protein